MADGLLEDTSAVAGYEVAFEDPPGGGAAETVYEIQVSAWFALEVGNDVRLRFVEAEEERGPVLFGDGSLCASDG